MKVHPSHSSLWRSNRELGTTNEGEKGSIGYLQSKGHSRYNSMSERRANGNMPQHQLYYNI